MFVKRSNFILLLLAVFLLAALTATGCSQETEGSPSVENGAGGEMPSGSINAQGSDTMVNMGQNLAEYYMDNVNPSAGVGVTGGGSGTGVAALINANTDIAQVSRTMTDDELAEAEANGVTVYEFIVAQDGLAIYVNEDNPIDELDVAQLKDVLTGEITEWSELGWEDGGSIDVFSRQSNSGTYVYINENIMDGADWAPGTRFQPGSSQVVEGVIADLGGIGYSGVGYLADGAKVLNIARVGEDAVSPLEAENVASGEYPIARPLFFYTNGFPEEGSLIRHYLDWILSPEGQDVVVESGFYAIHGEYEQINEDTFQGR